MHWIYFIFSKGKYCSSMYKNILYLKKISIAAFYCLLIYTHTLPYDIFLPCEATLCCLTYCMLPYCTALTYALLYFCTLIPPTSQIWNFTYFHILWMPLLLSDVNWLSLDDLCFVCLSLPVSRLASLLLVLLTLLFSSCLRGKIFRVLQK